MLSVNGYEHGASEAVARRSSGCRKRLHSPATLRPRSASFRQPHNPRLSRRRRTVCPHCRRERPAPENWRRRAEPLRDLCIPSRIIGRGVGEVHLRASTRRVRLGYARRWGQVATRSKEAANIDVLFRVVLISTCSDRQLPPLCESIRAFGENCILLQMVRSVLFVGDAVWIRCCASCAKVRQLRKCVVLVDLGG